jgi:hypothetical protein
VRVSFATNDERTAKRVSDALGTATEMKAMKNYAGSRLSPWLGHLMVSRSETARPLLTPGEIMQLPPTDEIVMMSGVHPIRIKKARYYEDARLQKRILPPPKPARPKEGRSDDWSSRPLPPPRSGHLSHFDAAAAQLLADIEPVGNGTLNHRHMRDHAHDAPLADKLGQNLQNLIQRPRLVLGVETPEPLVDEDCVQMHLTVHALDHVGETQR